MVAPYYGHDNAKVVHRCLPHSPSCCLPIRGFARAFFPERPRASRGWAAKNRTYARWHTRRHDQCLHDVERPQDHDLVHRVKHEGDDEILVNVPPCGKHPLSPPAGPR